MRITVRFRVRVQGRVRVRLSAPRQVALSGTTTSGTTSAHATGCSRSSGLELGRLEMGVPMA